MIYIDDCGACVPHEDILFFLKDFVKLADKRGCHLNRKKTRIMTPTLSTSSLPDIEQTYGKKISDKLRLAIATYSVKETPTLSPNDSPVINPTTNKPEITTTPISISL